MKLTLVTQHFAPHFEGGTEAVVRAQARELAALGHEVRVVSGTDRPHAGQDVLADEIDGIPVAFLPRTSDEPYDLSLRRPRLSALIHEQTQGSDLVHVHHWATLSGTLVRDHARELPVVVTLHDLFTTCPRYFRVPVAPVPRCPERGDVVPCARCVQVDAPGLSLIELEEGLAARVSAYQAELDAAAHVVTPSRSHAAVLDALVTLPATRKSVVAHGLCAPLRPVFGPPWTGTGRLRLLFLGHRSEIKGVRDLLTGLAGLPAADRERIELLLLGEQVEAGLDGRLRSEANGVALLFGGGYSVGELPARLGALGGAHLALCPSRVRESYGLVVDEALALGLPTWVSDRGAPPERVGAAGRVLPAENPAAWAEAVAAVLAAPAILEVERRAVPSTIRTAREAALDLERIYRDLLPAAP